jgi:hydroxymethylpyrimidine pyrophosphatase-like HAD family hydrolase
VKPLVGHRKVEALQALIHLWKATPADTMVVGTSPLDTAMLSAMAQAGGAGIMMGARKLASHGATSVATIEELRVFLQDWEGAHLAS